MKKIYLLLAVAAINTSGVGKPGGDAQSIRIVNVPPVIVPDSLRGNWMYGKFSMTEYWSQNPYTYLGNALQFAIAFTFEANGSYTQYFTSSSVMAGMTTYQQSVTKGKVEIDAVTKKIRTIPVSSHYKRTRNGQVLEERDMLKSEISQATNYSFTTGTETSGTKALYLTLQGTSSPLTFLKK